MLVITLPSIMKKTLTILLILFSMVSCGQNNSEQKKTEQIEPETRHYLAKRDSVILDTQFGSVYITRDTTIKLYDWLAPNKIDTIEFRKLYDTEFMTNFKERSNSQIKHFNNIPINGDWCSLYLFKDKFYVYSPSDWMFNNRMLISDSAIYNMSSSNWEIQLIQNFSKTPTGELKFNLVDYNGFKNELTIKFVDEDKSVSLWIYKLEGEQPLFELRVKSSNVRDYEMIINDCLGVKCYQEFLFETPEYDAIINAYGKSK